jgi:hypothetical protein
LNSNRHWLKLDQLPPYSPEFDPTKRLWQDIPENETRDRFFSGVEALFATEFPTWRYQVLMAAFRSF